jgi:hypothetical protein
VLIGLRNFITSSSSSTTVQAIALKYLQALGYSGAIVYSALVGPEIVALLVHFSKEASLNEEAIAVCSEAIRILVLAETLVQQQATRNLIYFLF